MLGPRQMSRSAGSEGSVCLHPLNSHLYIQLVSYSRGGVVAMRKHYALFFRWCTTTCAGWPTIT